MYSKHPRIKLEASELWEAQQWKFVVKCSIFHTMAKQLILSRRKDEVGAVLKLAKMLVQIVQNHFFFLVKYAN